MTDAVVATTDLVRRYRIGDRTVDALDGVTVSVRRGEFVAVVGVSGSGKSTLLQLLGGLDRPTSGRVEVATIELGSASDAELTQHRRHRIGFVFQRFNLLPRLTALENTALPQMFAGVPRARREARAKTLLEEVGLGHRLHHYPSQLSGGEQQRVAIARALVHEPAVILADEPTGNLDSATGGEILTLLRRLNRERGTTVLLVTHDPAAAAVADRVIHLRDGQVERIESGGVQDATAPEDSFPRSYPTVAGGSGESVSDRTSSPSQVETEPPAASNGSLRLDDLLRSASSNLVRRAVRSGLTIFGVFIGIITIVAMLSVALGVEREVQRNIEAIGLESVFVFPEEQESDSFDAFADVRPETPITPALVAELRRMPEVADVDPMVDLPPYLDLRVQLDDRAAPARVSRQQERFDPFEGESELLAGELLAPGAERGAVLSDRLARDLGIDTYDELVDRTVQLIVRLPRGETETFPVTVVGVIDDFGRAVALGTEDAVAIKRWWYGQPDLLETRGYDGVVVRARDLNAVPAVEDRIAAMGFEVRSLRSLLDLANRVFAVLNTLLGSVGGLALFVAALGVTNTMIMAVYERTHEIGILKAIGATRRDVLSLFVVEAALIGFLGGVLGLLLGALLGQGIDWAAHRYLVAEGVRGIGALSVVPWWLALGAVAFGTLVGLLAGVYPAYRAARLDPVAALRYE